jgi:hypothetical protein
MKAVLKVTFGSASETDGFYALLFLLFLAISEKPYIFGTSVA